MEDINQHFSKRILFLSFIFILITGVWYVLSALSMQHEYAEVAPKLVFVESHSVEVKTIYDDDYRLANTGQSLVSGTTIKTGELAFAEVTLGNNIVRLDQNTEIELVENNTDESLLVFDLISGNIWVNAYDEIEVEMAQSETTFSHSIGMMTYAKPLNRLMVISGSADLSLYNENDEYLADFFVPLNNQVTFVDSQLIPDYTLLKYSKLKKELKLASIASSVFEDEWVVRNLEVDNEYLAENLELVQNSFAYKIKDSYYKFLSYLTYVPATKEALYLNRVKLVLGYTLGEISEKNLKVDAKELVAYMAKLMEPLKESDMANEWVVKMYYAMGSYSYGSPAYLAKEQLLSHILEIEDSQALRVYLADLRVSLTNFELDESEGVLSGWFEHWDGSRSATHPNEFEKQSKILHSIIVAHIEKVTSEILDIYDKVGEKKLLQYAESDDNEVRFAITEERLEIASGLVSSYRYLAAKQYLNSSYESLNIDEITTDVAAKEIFLEHANLLAQRIDYAEQQMHGSASSIDESEFQEYLKMKERDDSISENLKAFLETGEETGVAMVPEIDDVISKFSKARISVIEQDIAPDSDSSFVFNVKSARLIDRALDGTSITFDAAYDYSSNAVNEVVVSGAQFKGSFELNDLVAVLTQNSVNDEEGVEDISDLLLDENDEALRAQAVGQDLARQLVLNELNAYEIQIGGQDNIEIIDEVNLTRFKITNAYVDDPTNPRKPIEIYFEYNSTNKKAYSVYRAETNQIISSEVMLSQLTSTVLGDLYVEQEKAATMNEFLDLIDSKKYYNIKEGNINIKSLNEIEFTEMSFSNVPVSINGAYNSTNNIFIDLNSELYSAENTSLEDYITILAGKYVMQYLAEKGLEVTESQMEMKYPFDEIGVINYSTGEKTFNFTLDINGNRLKDVTLVESGSTVDSMTFEEFNSINE